MDIQRGTAYDLSQVTDLDQIIDVAGLHAVAVHDAALITCMNPECGGIMRAGRYVGDNVRVDIHLVPDVFVLQALLQYREYHAHQGYPPHEPGE